MQARFDSALAPLIENSRGKIGLAVSGGGDSIALLRLTALSDHIDRERLCIFTVDHGLRAAAADEVRLVKKQAVELGLYHRTLEWHAPNPSQARARDARHRLLAQALKEAGGQLLLTGHTRSDNEESFLIRARAGSGWYGLSGMSARSASPVWPDGNGIFIARPMLKFDRYEVRAWLREEGAVWCDDPSNENEAYERVRMRQLLGKAPQLSARVARIQDKLCRLRIARDRQLAGLLRKAIIQDGSLAVVLPEQVKTETLAQCLAICAMVVAGTDRPARTARCVAAAERLAQTGPDSAVLTLGGTIVRKSGYQLQFQRESNRPNPPDPSESGSRLRHISSGLTGAAPAYMQFH